MAQSTSPSLSGSPPGALEKTASLLPGLLLAGLVAAAALGLQWLERTLVGFAWVEALVLAILLGAALRLVWTPSEFWMPGLHFSAKTLLEIAIALLGASVTGAAVLALGPVLLVAIVAVVAVAIVAGYAIGRAFGLGHAMSLLVACGNAICGNSAIAAVAPAINAEGEDVAAAIGFTAVLGIGVVLLVPVVASAVGYGATATGILAGLTVYAVPQVLAAAAPAGAVAIQMGAVVKLVRVLMLGPVTLILGLMHSGKKASGHRLRLGQMVPWFVIVFLGLLVARSLGAIPQALLVPLDHAVTTMTLMAMAGLGLMVDPSAVVKAGPKVAAVAGLCAVMIGVLALAVIALTGLSQVH